VVAGYRGAIDRRFGTPSLRAREGICLAGLLVIVPALNEEDTVAGVVVSVAVDLDAEVLVIDDGSHDATAARAREAGATVLSHPFNLGVGAALRTGFRYAVAHGYRVAVQVDADGQHETTEVKRLVDVIDGGADIAVGSRFEEGYETGLLRRTSMRLLSRRVSRHLGVTITDTTSGFRAFGGDAIARFAQSYPRAYLSDTVEALMLAADWHLRVEEIPVRMRPRQGGVPSAGSFKSTYHLVRLSLVIALHRFRRPLVRGQT
jgi:glycosyltransferase involved in cell wall biosynthesis